MREIKFRIPMFTDKGTFIEFQYLKLGDDIEGTLCGYNGEPQQFTGLLDKNGKEIYEGDIIGTHYANKDGIAYYFIVEMPDVYARAFIDRWELLGNVYQNPELIGNIYENQELLTK